MPRPKSSEPKAKKADNRRCAYCFTWNNYTDEDIRKLCMFTEEPKLKYLTYGMEVGESGTPHLQGFMYFNQKVSIVNIKKMLNAEAIHIEEKYEYSTFEAAIAYCHKDDKQPFEYGTRPLDLQERSTKGGKDKFKNLIEDVEWGLSRREVDVKYPGIASFAPHYISKLFNYKRLDDMIKPNWKLFDWQAAMKNTLLKSDPQDRLIYWIWSDESNTGKSTFFAQYMAYYLKENLLSVDTLKFADIIHAYQDQKCIHLDIPRCPEEDTQKFLYVVLEKLSNRGAHFSGKYDSQMKIVDAHVCITANIPPNPFKLPERFIEIKVFKDGTSRWFDWTGQNLVPPEMACADPSTAMKRKRDWEEEQELTKQMKLDEQRLKRARMKKDLNHLQQDGYL